MQRRIIELKGHILDSHILPRVLDAIVEQGGDFSIEHISIGKTNTDPSYARLAVAAADEGVWEQVWEAIQPLGAVLLTEKEAELKPAPQDGVFPDNFYTTTNLETRVRLAGGWVPVEGMEMDCGIRVDPPAGRAVCVPIHQVRRGDLIVVGNEGVQVTPLERPRQREVFSFMGSAVSSERPKGLVIAGIAREMRAVRRRGGKILVVLGPAVIHTGAGQYLERLIRAGFVQTLFAGNAVATHDIESALYGTSLGVSLASGEAVPEGHSHHLRAINAIRGAGGIRPAVASGLLTKGVMYTAVQTGVDYVLAGSIRDDGPLPDVISDTLAAQEAMRALLPGTELALMLGTMLHSIAVGNLLPARVRLVCVDINPAVVTKLVDRGSFQAVGVVSDVEWFLRQLAFELLDKKEHLAKGV
ncbi:TIGR00300 family protein [Gelria sp. Kuro-4]|uniref:ornithine cyclodeaminase n=1 Tax=Gelria sp. Kuro-4 TaxID=2796927 RepID=UPI001BEF2827|nr:TIGR00300 family protein [Gelria sp. Kuro-4]BCV24453.1 TIGR00300 family protein [Gelria sp. Kuro-4]